MREKHGEKRAEKRGAAPEAPQKQDAEREVVQQLHHYGVKPELQSAIKASGLNPAIVLEWIQTGGPLVIQIVTEILTVLGKMQPPPPA